MGKNELVFQGGDETGAVKLSWTIYTRTHVTSIGERMALYEPTAHLRLGSAFDHVSLPSLPKDERDGAYASFSGI